MRWPWQRRETRSQGAYTASYVQSARMMAATGTDASLSATVATCAGVWTRAFGMLSPEGGASDALSGEVLSQIGADLFWRGESCWHIGFDGSDLSLTRAAHWDEQAGGRFVLSIPTPDGIQSIKALAPEVVRLVINPDPSMPWRGRSPLAFLGLSARLMAEIESSVVNALPYAGKGILPLPANLGEQSGAVTAGLRSGGLAVVTSKADLAHHTGGRAEEWRRVELTPDLSKMELNGLASDLHSRVLGALGVPPGLLQQGGNSAGLRETYRIFALGTIAPLAASISPELKRKLGVERLSIDGLMSADVAGRARAVSSLVQSGLGLAEAMALVGWSGVSVPDGSKASPGAVKEAVEE